MTNPRPGFPESKRASTLLMLVINVFVFVVVYFTGGESSSFLPLIFLPVVLAVTRFSFETVVALGLTLTFVYLVLLDPNVSVRGMTTGDVVRALCLNATTVVGGLFARQVQREQAQLRETVEEQEALLNVSQMVNAADKLEHALNSALHMLRALVPGCSCVAIFLTDDARRELVQEASVGCGLSEQPTERVRIGADLVGWSLEDSGPHYVSDTSAQPSAFMADYHPGARSFVCVSLRSLRVPIGMIYVASEKPNGFTRAQVGLARALADRIGFPLQRLRLQEGLRNLAFRDPMTNLYNFRAFRTHLDDELKRSVRYGHPLSLLILDIDGFKAINDRYGHPAGDQMLIGLANVLRATVRATDVPVRYGGEEFAVVCPETTAQEALVAAERIRSAVEVARFELGPGEACAVTCSVGVATFPENGKTDSALVDAADRALYGAKHSGKNCVIQAEPHPSLSPEAPA